MAVIGNTTNTVGDKLWIKGTLPLIGITNVLSFTDNVNGETASYFYTKQFRYSKNNSSWSNWIELNNSNLQLISVENTDILNFEYLYIHSTSISAPIEHTLSFDSITLSGNYSQIECGNLFKQSIFGKWFNCMDAASWCFNVSGKLFEKGIIPAYITRNEDEDNADYIAFWKTISYYFSWFVYFARKIGLFENDLDLYKEFLKQRNIFYCQKESEITQLRAIGQNYLKEIQKRGTNKIISKNTSYNDIKINGELLRLVCFNDNDEFLFNLNEKKNFGWNIGNSSPMWKSLYHHSNFNKAYEPNGGFTDINSYPLINNGLISITNSKLQINGCDSLTFSGIGPGSLNESILNFDYRKFAIVVNPKISYEISFLVTQTILGSWLSFGVLVYDENFNKVEIKLAGLNSGSDGSFIKRESLNIANEEYLLRGIVYNFFEDTQTSTTNLGIGQNLQFDDLSTKYIIPFIINDQRISNNSDAHLIIKNLQIKPTIKNYSTCFLHSNNWIDIWVQQNNESLVIKNNSKSITFKTISDQNDPDYNNPRVLRISGLGSKQIFDWNRCIPGLQVNSNIFPDNTFIKRVSFYDAGHSVNVSGGNLINQITYKVEFTNNYQDINNLLSSETGDKIFVYGYKSYPKLESIMERYLLPYNVNFKNNYI